MKTLATLLKGLLGVFAMVLLMSSQAQEASSYDEYTTIADGNWTNASIWENGDVPPIDNVPDDAKIKIRHIVTRNSNNDLENEGIIEVKPYQGSTAKLIITEVDVYNKNEGEIKVEDAAWHNYRFDGGGDSGQSRNGNFYNTDDAYLYVKNSVMETAQNWKNDGDSKAKYENSCILAGENYTMEVDKTSGGWKDEYKNSNISIGWHGSGNFKQEKGKVKYNNARIQLAGTSGNFELNDGNIEGTINLITLKNHDTGNIGSGVIQTSSDVSGKVYLDYYYAQSAGKLQDQGNKFKGNKTFQDETSTYFPGMCGPVPTPDCDIAVTKTTSNAALTPGEQFVYTITVVNNGPDEAENVEMEDILPTELTLNSYTVSTGSWSAPTWTIGDMASGATETMTITVTVNAGVSGNIVNTATISTTTTDTDANNNTDDATINVTIPVIETDMAIVKTASETDLEPGDTFTYTITLTNNGPDDAENVTVNDIIPTDLTVISTNPSTGTWSAPTWTVGDFAVGDTETLVFTVEVNSGVSGVVTNTATVSTTTTDTDSNNNTDDVVVTVSSTPTIIENYFPATGYGTLAFEDLWPGKGDYDFNDLVIDYQFEILSNTQNYIFQVTGTFIIQAFGAGFENGFGFQLPDALDQSDLTATGYDIQESYVTLGSNGLEDGQSKPTIIVYDNAFNLMPHPGGGTGVNTSQGAPYVEPDTIVITINITADTYTSNDLDISNFNPFIIVNQTRGVEVHLPDYAPTDLADMSLFGTAEDDSDPAAGRYYKTDNNLPWAISIYETFAYPYEKVQVNSAYNWFMDWALSGGVDYPDWYKDEPGYRNDSNIYSPPSQ